MSEETKAAKAATKKAAAEVKEPVMYVGPTIPGIAAQNTVYTEMPAAAKTAAETLPDFNNLFIPVRDYPEANKMLREKKGYIYSAWKKAESYKSKSKGGAK